MQKISTTGVMARKINRIDSEFELYFMVRGRGRENA